MLALIGLKSFKPHRLRMLQTEGRPKRLDNSSIGGVRQKTFIPSTPSRERHSLAELPSCCELFAGERSHLYTLGVICSEQESGRACGAYTGQKIVRVANPSRDRLAKHNRLAC